MFNLKSKLKLPQQIKANGVLGYDSDELSACLGENFDNWMRGSTVMQYPKPDGSIGCLVYAWDVQAYLAGRPNLD